MNLSKFLPNTTWLYICHTRIGIFYYFHLLDSSSATSHSAWYLPRKLCEHSPTYMDDGQMGKICRADTTMVLWKAILVTGQISSVLSIIQCWRITISRRMMWRLFWLERLRYSRSFFTHRLCSQFKKYIALVDFAVLVQSAFYQYFSVWAWSVFVIRRCRCLFFASHIQCRISLRHNLQVVELTFNSSLCSKRQACNSRHVLRPEAVKGIGEVGHDLGPHARRVCNFLTWEDGGSLRILSATRTLDIGFNK
jgi:hypothetical protein